MGGNFRFQVQDSFLEYFFLKIGRFEEGITLSEKNTFNGDHAGVGTPYIEFYT